jgi:hypothetical protein
LPYASCRHEVPILLRAAVSNSPAARKLLAITAKQRDETHDRRACSRGSSMCQRSGFGRIQRIRPLDNRTDLIHIGTFLFLILVIVFWAAIGWVILFTLVAVAVGVALFYSLPTIIVFVGDGSWPYLLGCLLMLWVAVFVVCYCLNSYIKRYRAKVLPRPAARKAHSLTIVK